MNPPIRFQPVKLSEGMPRLFVANDGEGQNRVTFFRSAFNTNQDMERVEGTNIFIIGGDATRKLLYDLLSTIGRRNLQDVLPGGISGKPHTRLRAYLNITANTQERHN